ncbi:phage holin family protein [Paracoccus shanxieyensis]|uniref:Phage holin family protein n=1 Tax=Paracoccus shanxieyensis TaxID=2675752 RepID=A0A6L6IWG3_9RHOB|nr:phage holin family protein [Paracoccus shanxieyensis]MTH63602.1 phage holin family protein [Paracoccus shanxieyensis]MTH86523.1 phage holin family protein [Paracoccus shanxieyensis]
MFAYARNMQLALSDKLRRAGLASAAGIFLLVGAGFLLAALWTFLARNMGWGPLHASLAIGGGSVVIALILVLMARRERHAAPTPDELRDEVQQQLNLLADTAITRASDAADAAMGRASAKASELMGLAENRAHSFADDLSYRATRMVDRTEAKVQGAAMRMGEDAARRFGISPAILQVGRRRDAGEGGPVSTFAPLLGAFAVGITLASRVQDWRHRDDDLIDDHDDWDDDWIDDDPDDWPGHR